MASWIDILVLSLSAFVGNVGVALTGFGMAIVYLFVWQIAVLSGYASDFKYAVFIQAIALLAAQPLLVYKAQVFSHASRRMLNYFIPVTILATPLGQITGDRVSTEMVETVGGILVSFVAVFEVYQKRQLFFTWFCCCFGKKQPETPLPTELVSKVSAGRVSREGATSCNDSACDPDLHNDYTLLEEIGRGNYSIVKAGMSLQDGRRYAIKICDKSKLLDGEIEKLQDEIDIMKELEHPNILGLVDCYEEPKHFFLVSEMMSGGDLFSRLAAAGYFSEFYARSICDTVLDALRYMHSKKIAHRDLKPENLLLQSDRADAAVKIADLGFAKKLKSPNSFKTMCGTPSYVAPEILKSLKYGLSCDLWSLGVLVFVMLAGYQPFRGETDDEVKEQIIKADFSFDEQYFKDTSAEAKQFITALLNRSHKKRVDAFRASAHPWFNKVLTQPVRSEFDDSPVFFMIGSQRSGSNWLRTMLDEREDLAGPHPPHMMRDFSPILDKFGDLGDSEQFRVLVDHVTTFVERNQVPWTDKHGNTLLFPRVLIYSMAWASCQRVKEARHQQGNGHALSSKMYLLAIFDAIMNYYAKANGKRMWMCKSMGMHKFHDLLLEFYGEKRLRYIYLVRDPRDVAMSFMKTPVGDCHYYAIIKKWTDLQGHASRVLKECPDLIHKVHYEDILVNKEKTVTGVYNFIGERRFGGIKRQASVMFMNPTEDLINAAQNGREAQKACGLSYQFKNLGRGASFAKTQIAKWKNPETGLSSEALEIIESVAHEMMDAFGYKTHLVNQSMPPKEYSSSEIATFDSLNKQGIKKMNEELKEENPGDFERRMVQSATLSLLPTLIEDSDWESDGSSVFFADDDQKKEAFLSEDELAIRMKVEPTKIATLASGRSFRFASATQRGYYPAEHDKPNQDVGVVHTALCTHSSKENHWFSVYDGHGPSGHLCAQSAAANIPFQVGMAIGTGLDAKLAMVKAHVSAHQDLVADKSIPTDQSGSTATTVILRDDGKLVVGNVGDSVALLGSEGKKGVWTPRRLCTEHTPFREDERARILRAGGLVMSVDQRDGVEPIHEHWTTETPPRIWSPKNDKFPGCGFTRSLGDEVAHTLGVSATPEMFEYNLDEEKDRVIIVASDGVTEFLDDKSCLDIVRCFPKDPSAAAAALIHEASQCWIERGDYMDDITAIVIFFDGKSPQDVEDGLLTETPTPKPLEDSPDELSAFAIFWTLLAGAASGFLGGLCGIRGPPIILYMLHTPAGVAFTKQSQRATGAAITFTNVLVRVAYYLVKTLGLGENASFDSSDWILYLSVVLCSLVGVFVGSKLFERLQDNKATIRGILTLFLLLCGTSLLISSYSGI